MESRVLVCVLLLASQPGLPAQSARSPENAVATLDVHPGLEATLFASEPRIASPTNIDVDHLDTYRDLDEIQDAFVTFASRVPFFGQVILCLDDPRVQALLPRLDERRVVTYGTTSQAVARSPMEPLTRSARAVSITCLMLPAGGLRAS